MNNRNYTINEYMKSILAGQGYEVIFDGENVVAIKDTKSDELLKYKDEGTGIFIGRDGEEIWPSSESRSINTVLDRNKGIIIAIEDIDGIEIEFGYNIGDNKMQQYIGHYINYTVPDNTVDSSNFSSLPVISFNNEVIININPGIWINIFIHHADFIKKLTTDYLIQWINELAVENENERNMINNILEIIRPALDTMVLNYKKELEKFLQELIEFEQNYQEKAENLDPASRDESEKIIEQFKAIKDSLFEDQNGKTLSKNRNEVKN